MRIGELTTRRVALTQEIVGVSGLKARQIAALVVLAIVGALFEGVGIGLLLPVLQFLESGAQAVAKSGGPFWSVLIPLTETIGVPISLGLLLVLAFIPIVARQIAYYTYTSYSNHLQVGIVSRLRREGFESFIGADVAFFGDQGRTTLLSALTGHCDWAGTAIFNLLTLLSIFTMGALYVGLLIIVSPVLASAAVVAVGISSLAVRRNLVGSRGHGREAAQASTATYKVVGERIDAVRLIKMRGREAEESHKVALAVDRLASAQRAIALSRARVEVMLDPLLMLAVFGILYFGSQVLGLSLSGLGLFLFVLLRLNNKVKEFNVIRQSLLTSVDSLLLVKNFIASARSSAGRIKGGSAVFHGLKKAIRLQGITFAYDRALDRPVLDGVTLTIPLGTTTALVGKSGSGKTTLVDIIARLREPLDGLLAYDDIAANELDVSSLRRKIGFMTQDSVFFDDTVRANLIYGIPDPPDDAFIWDVLRRAYADSFVRELPDGLETTIGELGVRLSGGQRQRLALARELMRQPDVLVLDEPTSALDSESESYIQAALAELHGALTLIIIAHRLSTVQGADRIVVLDGGRLVEEGTHCELIERDGIYRQLFELQLAT